MVWKIRWPASIGHARLDMGRPGKICIVVSAPLTLKAFMLGHATALANTAEVTLVANFAPEDESFPWPQGIARVAIPIVRPISPLADLRALFALIRLFRQRRFDLVHSVTPKAGLLAMLAAALARVPLRLHTYTGQVWVTQAGAMRAALKAADRLIARLATHALADSPTQRAFLIAEGILAGRDSTVLAQGSICGVDTTRFHPDPIARERIRRIHGIAPGSVVFLYLGRINRDKGLLDLVQAFSAAGKSHADAHLLLVGPDEGRLAAALEAGAAASSIRLHRVDFTDRPEEYFAAADVFCLPSYREGFGSTIIEAAAAELPAIGSRIYGVTDAIEEGETGLLFEPGDIGQLTQCMLTLAGDAHLRARMGKKARERAERDFSSKVVTKALLEYYDALLAQRAD